MHEKGSEVKIVIEGPATRLIPELAKEGNPLLTLYEKAKSLDLIEGVCKGCSNKMETLGAAHAEGFALPDDMKSHPGMAGYLDERYRVITF